MSEAPTRTPRFGALVTNHIAPERNPQRTGYFVRSGRRTGRLNPGLWWEMTDGRGNFWQLHPKEKHFIGRLTVDYSTELPQLGGKKDG